MYKNILIIVLSISVAAIAYLYPKESKDMALIVIKEAPKSIGSSASKATVSALGYVEPAVVISKFIQCKGLEKDTLDNLSKEIRGKPQPIESYPDLAGCYRDLSKLGDK